MSIEVKVQGKTPYVLAGAGGCRIAGESVGQCVYTQKGDSLPDHSCMYACT